MWTAPIRTLSFKNAQILKGTWTEARKVTFISINLKLERRPATKYRERAVQFHIRFWYTRDSNAFGCIYEVLS